MPSLIDKIEENELKGRRIPKIKSGDIVRFVQTYKEKDKERSAIFEGIVIKVNSGSGTRKSITIRKVIDGIGVEKIVPLALSNISKIEVLKSSKTRRAKLYYLRGLSGKKARLKDKRIDQDVLKFMVEGAEEKENKEEKISSKKDKDKATEKKKGKDEPGKKQSKPRK